MRFLKQRVIELINARQLLEHGGGDIGVRDASRLVAAVNRPQDYLHYNPDADVFALAALYLESIAHDHPFENANKRTGWVCARTFLRLNGADVEMPHEKILALAIGTARGTLKADAIAEHLRAHAAKR